MINIDTGLTPLQNVCEAILRLTYQETVELAARIRDILLEENAADGAFLTTFAVAEALVAAAEYERTEG